MITKEEILNILQERKPDLVKRFGLERLALFGSFARGDNKENSDVDILVEVPPTMGLEFVDLAEEIETILGMPADGPLGLDGRQQSLRRAGPGSREGGVLLRLGDLRAGPGAECLYGGGGVGHLFENPNRRDDPG